MRISGTLRHAQEPAGGHARVFLFSTAESSSSEQSLRYAKAREFYPSLSMSKYIFRGPVKGGQLKVEFIHNHPDMPR